MDHLLALLAVGLWSRQQRQGIVLPPVFLVLMALGASCAGLLADGMLPALETSISATVLLLGGLAAAALRMPPQLAVALVGLCGFLHGLAHGRELAGMASGAGFLLASALLMGVGMAVASGERRRRMAGAAIGAAAPLPCFTCLRARLIPARPGGSAPHPSGTSPARRHRPGDRRHVGGFVAGQGQGPGDVDDLPAVVDRHQQQRHLAASAMR
jgi:hydrogenase/urease accessory protein HupE